PSAERAGDRSNHESPQAADPVAQRSSRMARRPRASGGEGPERGARRGSEQSRVAAGGRPRGATIITNGAEAARGRRRGAPSAERAGDRSNRESPQAADPVAQRSSRMARRPRAGGGEGPRARSAQGIGAITSRRRRPTPWRNDHHEWRGGRARAAERAPSAERAWDRSNRESPQAADPVAQRSSRMARRPRASGGEGPRARSAQGIGAIASRRRRPTPWRND